MTSPTTSSATKNGRIGYISKQLIDNKIVMTETPGYIERTLIGTVKLWLQNLSDESLKTLRSNKKSNGELATTTIEILYKYEVAIKCKKVK